MNNQRINIPPLRRAALVERAHGDLSRQRSQLAMADDLVAADRKAWAQVAPKLSPDQIVADGLIPQENGHALGKKREADPEASRLLVVLLTVRNEAEYRIEGILSGADHFIPDQSDLSHLKARIKTLIESRHGLKEELARQQVSGDTGFTVSPPDDPILTKAIKVVEEHMIDEDFSVDRFSQLMGMSRSTLKRKLKALTGQSPQPFVQELRLKRAASLLAAGGISISETARLVGFYDLSHFGRVFKGHFGCTPSRYGQKLQTRPPVAEVTAPGGSNLWRAHYFGPNPVSFDRCL